MEEKKKYKLEFNLEELNVIHEALKGIAYRVAEPIITSLRNQFVVQEQKEQDALKEISVKTAKKAKEEKNK